jgi:carbonic anhydrase/acetyltransferase-like protein (isoleucine patch superfamily)
MTKYVITDDSVLQDGLVLHRIVRTSDNQKGGFIQSEANLSQDGSCFVHADSRVFGGARVEEDAQIWGVVRDQAVVRGSAKIIGEVAGSSIVEGSATVNGKVEGSAQVRGESTVLGRVHGSAVVDGSARIIGEVGGSVHVGSNEVVEGNKS